jgi:exodeoxyribonuclease VII large subunit
MTQFQLNLAPERKVWSVSELTERIRDLLAGEFTDIWVEGEISNCHEAQSGHLYFTLKDARAQARCVCFRNNVRLLKFRPEDGLHVTVRGSVDVYEPRGEYQIYVEHVEPVGLGALQLAFEQLKKRLEAEGLFDPSEKKPLPVLPGRIGLVTSPKGAAVRDIVRILRRRFPNVRLVLYPVRVQGEGAAGDIVEAIKFFNAKQMVDVMILARGGGSLEDLWAFNEEKVARAIAGSQIPIISGVGHETDFTIADFVADVRVSTPSAAAEIVVQTRQEFDQHLVQQRDRMEQRTRYLLLEMRHRLQELAAHRGFRRLEELLRQYRQQADELVVRLGQGLQTRLEQARRRFTIAQTRIAAFDLRARIATLRLRVEQRSAELRVRAERFLLARRQRLERLMVQLDERSPLGLLERGYAIIYDAAGRVVRSVEQVAIGDELAVQLARGRLAAEVKRKEEK